MAKLEKPRCQFKGAAPHPARPAYQLVWDLQSGPLVKWSCAAHRYSFGGNRGYWVNRTEGYAGNGEPGSHELAASLDIPEEASLREITQEEERTLVKSDEEQ